VLNFRSVITLIEANNVKIEADLIQVMQIWRKATMTAKYGFLHYCG